MSLAVSRPAIRRGSPGSIPGQTPGICGE